MVSGVVIVVWAARALCASDPRGLRPPALLWWPVLRGPVLEAP